MSATAASFYQEELDRDVLAALIEGREVTANELVEGLYHGQPQVRRNAARGAALVASLPDPGHELLRIGVNDTDEEVRLAIVSAMSTGDYPVDLAIPILFNGLLDSVEDIADQALQGLELRMTRDYAAVIPLLVDGLRDARPLVGSVCGDLLVKANAHSVAATLPLLAHDDPALRRAAFAVFESVRHSAVTELVEALRDLPAARRLVGRLLGGVAKMEPEHVAALEGYAAGDDRELAEAATTLLDGLRRPKPPPPRTEPLVVPIDGFLERALSAEELASAVAADVPLGDLLYALRDGRDHVRANAAGLLGLLPAARDAAGEVVAALAPGVRDPAPTVRRAACAALAAFGGLDATRALVRGLEDTEPDVVQAAFDGLVGLGVDATPAILDALTAKQPARLHDVVVELFVRHGAAAANLLADALADAPAAAARVVAARALGGIGKGADDGIASLLGALVDPSAEVRAAAARAVGFVGVDDETILGALRQALRDPVPSVRRSAAIAASRITGRPLDDRGARDAPPIPVAGFEDGPLTVEAIAEARGDVPLDAFVSKLTDGREVVRANAARAVGSFGPGGGPGAEALAPLLRDGAVAVRRAAIDAYRRLEKAAEPAAYWVLGALADADPEVADVAVETLAALHASIADFLVEGLRAPPDAAPATIHRVFGRLEAKGVPILKAALKNGSALIRLNAARALELVARKGGDAALDDLEARLADPVRDVRAAASAAIDAIKGGIPKPPKVLEAEPLPIDGFTEGLLDAEVLAEQTGAVTVERLVRALRDGRSVVRYNTALLLGFYAKDGGPAVGPLSVAIKDSVVDVRRAAAASLGRLGPDAEGPIAEVLVGALSDPAPSVVAAASEALVALGDEAVPALLAGLARPVAIASRTVLPILARRGEAAREALGEALADESPAVRAAAARGILMLGRELAQPARDRVDRATSDSDAGVRAEARRTLDHIDGKDLAPAALEPAPLPHADFATTLLTREVLEGLGDKLAVSRLIAALYDGRWCARANAAASLAVVGEEASGASSDLLVALKDGRAEVRQRAAEALGAIGPDRERAFELIVALDDPAPLVVDALEAALARYGDAAIEAYLYGLDSLPALVARSVLPMLARLGKKAVDPLVAALSYDSAQVRLNGLIGLRLLGQKVAHGARAAVALLRGDGNRDVRLEANRTLDFIDGIEPPPLVREPLPLPLPGFDIEALALADLEAASKDLDAALLEALIRDGRRHVRENAARALGVVKAGGEQLGHALKDSVPAVRLAAVEALASLGAGAVPAAEPLVSALTDGVREVRAGARDVLVGLGVAAWDALRGGLRVSPDLAVRTVLPVLVGVGAPAVPKLIETLDDPSPFLRLNALGGLVKLHDHGAEAGRARIEELTGDPLESIARTAQLVLDRLNGKVPGPLALDEVPMPVEGFDTASLDDKALAKAKADPAWLVTALADGRPFVRENAARALGGLGKKAGDDAVSTLARALKDSHGPVRVAAATSLGALKAEVDIAAPALAAALRGADAELGGAALEALAAFGAKAVVPALLDADAKHLRGREEWVVETIGRVAHTMPEPFVKALAAVATDAERNLVERENAVSILGDLGFTARAAESALLELLVDMQGMLSVKAVKALARGVATPGKEICATLSAHLLRDPRPSVHYAVRDAVRLLKRNG